MLDFIRTHRRLMQFLLLLIILPSFAFVGLESYTRMGGGANAVAKVGGQTITQQEFDAAHRQQMDRLRQMFGGQVDAAMFDTPQARQGILDNLIAQKALLAEAARNNLTVPDSALQQTILGIPDLATPDGHFDGERYKAMLAMQGMTPAMFEARLRQDLALQALTGAIQGTGFAPRSLATRLSEIGEQERQVQEQVFKAEDYLKQVKVTEEMVKEAYDKSGNRFMIPEQARAEYLVLSLDALASQVQVSDADIQSYYEQNAKRYATPEERRASHILIAADKDAPAAERQAAKAKAEQLLAQVRKNPADFAKLAKENSQDPGSAEKGGDLGFFGQGMMVKPFEEAAWQLKEGQISGVVESDFGYHIIQVTGIKPGSAKPQSEVRDQIAAEIKKQQAAKKYTELAETFSNLVYEQADSLKPTAEKLGLQVQTADKLTRSPNPALPKDAPYNQERFLAALFSDDVLKNKHNTEAVEVAPNTLIAGRVAEHKPATRRPYEEVKEEIRRQVAQAEAEKLAVKAGQERLAALQAKPAEAGFGAAKTVSRAKDGGLAPNVLAAVMKADAAKLPAFVGAEVPGQGYAVVRINQVAQPEKTDEARRQADREQLGNLLAQQEMQAYVQVLKENAKAKIVKPVANTGSGEKEEE
ncbi:MAG: SurA N-terminal domain-containing protein [Noviherbaspirillum sp.]